MRGKIDWQQWHDTIAVWVMEGLTDLQIAAKLRAATGVTLSKQSVAFYRNKSGIKTSRQRGQTISPRYGRAGKPKEEIPIRYENGIPVIECPTRYADTILWGRWVR